MSNRQKVFSYLVLALFFTLGSCASHHRPRSAPSEAAISPTTQAKVRTVAVVPISLVKKPAQQNGFTVRVAEGLTAYLQHGSSYKVMSQGEVSVALTRIGLKHEDLTGVPFPDIAKGLPGNDIIVFVGPNSGEESWFPCTVVRPRDMLGRTTSFWSVGPQDTSSLPDFKNMRIEVAIRNVFSE